MTSRNEEFYPKTELPPNWVLTTLGAIRLSRSQNIKPSDWADEKFELYSVPSFEESTPEIIFGKEIGSNKQTVKGNSVLLCKINPRINRVWIVGDFSPYTKIASTEWIVFEQIGGLNPKYLRYFMQQSRFRDYLSANTSGIGGSLTRIKPSVIENFPFPLPPTSEQNKIVEEIEKQFSRLDAALDGLKRAKEKLRYLKMATLKAATNGTLIQTEYNLAKSENREYEPGEKLLSNILHEREVILTNEQINKLKTSVKQPSKSKKNQYEAPIKPDIKRLLVLPKGWTWATMDELSWSSSYGTSEKTNYDWTGTPVLRIPNITRDGIELGDIKRTKETLTIKEYTYLNKGDFLVIRTNGSKDLIGRGGVILTDFEEAYYFASYLIRFRLLGDRTLQEWIALQWNSDNVRNIIESLASTTAGQYNIRLSSLKNICVPIPPVAEQCRILNEFQRRQSVLDTLEKTININLKRIEILRQIILKSAFEGELVSQDLTDENAEELLKRIIDEKNISTSTKTKRIQPAGKTSKIKKKELQGTLPFETDILSFRDVSTQPKIQFMKLIGLKIRGRYKSLDNFEQTFRRGRNSTVDALWSPICLVGLNGSGKSNLIEILSEIFCYLEIINLPYKKIPRKDKQTDLQFEIEYELPLQNGKNASRRIKISKLSDSLPTFTELINDDEKSIDDPNKQLDALPARIIGYSSGLNETISIPFFKVKSLYSKAVTEQAFEEERKKRALEPVANTRTLFMDYDTNAAILLANYLFSTESKLKEFRQHLRIEDIASFHITFQLVYGGNKPVKLTSELKDSIARLRKCATDTFEEEEGIRFTCVYEVNSETRKKFREQFPDAKSFFTAIYKLSLLNVLALTGSERKFFWREDVREGMLERPPTVPKEQKIFNIEQLRLKLSQPKKEIDYAGISDGEHQFIHVFGTVTLFDEPGCLFLLDEPETHFNPWWRREFVRTLEVILSSKKQEFIVSTHSPFVVSGCQQENVFKFERQGESVVCKRVDFETYGSSFDFLLMKLFDLDTLISEKAFIDLEETLKSDNLKVLEDAVSRFGESFEKRFLFERIAEIRGRKK